MTMEMGRAPVRGETGSLRERKAARKPRWPHLYGQGLLEFMLVTPVLLLVIMGIIEGGRMLLIYSGVTSASREASRYGASTDDNGQGTLRYLDCEGMRAAARRLATMSELRDGDIVITYDHGDVSQQIATCDSHPRASLIELGDRVVVTVSTTYTPIVPLVPIGPMTITSSTARTILKEVAVGGTPVVVGSTATSTPAPPPASPTSGPSPTPTETVVPTATYTATAGPSRTPTVTSTTAPTPTEVPVPQNFSASIQCSTLKVSFSWTHNQGVDSYYIYYISSPNDVLAAIDSNPPCSNCDVLPDGGITRTYYIEAVVFGHPSRHSSTVSVFCP